MNEILKNLISILNLSNDEFPKVCKYFILTNKNLFFSNSQFLFCWADPKF